MTEIIPKSVIPVGEPPKVQPEERRDIKEIGVYPLELPRAEEYLQGKVWGLRDFLEGFTCKSTFLPNDLGIVIALDRSATVGDAFQKMIQHEILSLPILDPTTKKPLYVLSMMHILDFLLSKYDSRDFETGRWQQFLQSILWTPESEAFKSASLLQLEELPRLALDPAPTIDQEATLGQALKVMLESNSHRVLVTNQTGDMVKVLTQSRIVELVSCLIGSIPKCAKAIDLLGLGTKPVISINENRTAFEAFQLMREKKLSGLPITTQTVQHAGEEVLVGNISISDLKLIGFHPDYWNMLGKPLKDYLNQLHYKPQIPVRSQAFALLKEKGAPELVRSREFHTLGHVIRSLAFFRVHRIFVVDSTGAPTAVITLTDVLKELVKDV